MQDDWWCDGLSESIRIHGEETGIANMATEIRWHRYLVGFEERGARRLLPVVHYIAQ